LHKSAVIELAREWLEFANQWGVFYWLDYGSLLSAVRDGGDMMPWDHDADFSMMHRDVPRVMQRAKHFESRGISLTLHPTPRAGVRLSKRDVYIDIFSFEQDAEAPSFLTRSGRWHTIWGTPGPKENFPWYFVQPPLTNTTFEGMVRPPLTLRHRHAPYRFPVVYARTMPPRPRSSRPPAAGVPSTPQPWRHA
jgi:hypothetical protein